MRPYAYTTDQLHVEIGLHHGRQSRAHCRMPPPVNPQMLYVEVCVRRKVPGHVMGWNLLRTESARPDDSERRLRVEAEKVRAEDPELATSVLRACDELARNRQQFSAPEGFSVVDGVEVARERAMGLLSTLTPCHCGAEDAIEAVRTAELPSWE